MDKRGTMKLCFRTAGMPACQTEQHLNIFNHQSSPTDSITTGARAMQITTHVLWLTMPYV